MKKRRLSESMEMQVLATSLNIDIVYRNTVAGWSGRPYGELSALLGYLMFLGRVHQTHHWIAKGDPFYGDHELFSRLYGGIPGEVDSLAEKAVGLGSTDNVDLVILHNQVVRWTSLMCPGVATLPSSAELARRSLDCEMAFLRFSALTAQILDESGMLTRGLDNMLQGLEDVHEGNVYLLKQRITRV